MIQNYEQRIRMAHLAKFELFSCSRQLYSNFELNGIEWKLFES